MTSGLAAIDMGSPEARAALGQSVAQDLEAIFRDVRPAPDAEAGGRVRHFRRLTAGGRRPALATVGALLVAGLLGVAGGAALRPPLTPVPAPMPATRLLPVEMASAETAAPAPAVDAAPAPAAAVIEKSKPLRVERPRAHHVLTAGCPGRCGRHDVMAADRNLRRAYATAIRAGVPRPILASYRSRWDSLRHTREPHRLVSGYGQLAMGLDVAASRARARRS